MSDWAVIGQNKLQSGPDVMPIITEMALWDVGVSKLFFCVFAEKVWTGVLDLAGNVKTYFDPQTPSTSCEHIISASLF